MRHLPDLSCATSRKPVRPCIAAAVTAFSMALGGAGAAQAIVLNDGAAEQAGGIGNYYDRANSLGNVVSLFSLASGTTCTGTLINARTILTASHCVVKGAGINPSVGGLEIRFAPIATDRTAADRPVSGVLAHPTYRSSRFGVGDIALLSLSAPVTTVRPVILAGPDGPFPQKGALAVIAGYGAHGTGTNPPEGYADDYDDKRRIGQTNIGAYQSPGPGLPPWILAQFRNPLSPGNPDGFGLNKAGVPVPPFQASPAPGDSGGPIFLVTENGLVQIGTVIGTPGTDSTVTKAPGYGIYENWTPVAAYLDWLAASNPLRQVAARGAGLWSDPATWADLYSGAPALPDNRDGAFTKRGTLGRYYQVALLQPGAVTLDMNATVDDLGIEHAGASLAIGPARRLTVFTGTGLSAGLLAVDGDLETGFLSLNGGLLTGGGRITAPGGVFNTGGVVAPDGTLRVAGDFIQNGHGTLAIRMAGGASDSLAVSRRAFLGGTLELTAQPGAVTPGDKATVLRAGTVIGRFDTVVSGFSSAFLEADIAYGARTVTATVTRNGVRFQDVAWSPNGKAVAAAAETAFTGGAIGNAIVALDAASGARAFESLSGEAHASVASVAYGEARLIESALLGRLRAPFGPVPSLAQGSYPAAFAADAPARAAPVPVVPANDAGRLSLWGEGFGSWGRLRADGHAAALDTSTGGFVLGADALLDPAFRVGLAGGFLRTSFERDAVLSSGSTESVFGALYGSASWGAVGLRLGASYARHDIETQRAVSFPGYGDALSASYDGGTLQAFGELGYAMTVGAARIEPFVGASILRLHTDAFVEQGGAAALTGYGRDRDLAATTLGIRAEGRLIQDFPLVARGLLGWRHAYGDVEPEALLAFAGGAAPFAVAGVPVDRDALVMEAGLDWQASDAVSLGVAYAGQVGRNAQDHSVKGHFVWRFDTR